MKDLQKIRSVFCEALEKETPEEREAYLKRACQDDLVLRAEVDTLLRTHSKANDFFKGPLIGPAIPEDNLSEAPGTIIDRYKLLEKIGEGGMAVVYMAEQQKPIHRKVALKIIKLGMDTKSVIARFEAERQALAMMDHPNIAKVLDAGATETGRPYFVMDLVPGVSITEYCDKNRLSIKERLKLFITVCDAVQHAHQKGIIHRDVKPSNVMVTLHGGKPVPKMIDFGIAKAINQKLTEKTLFTRYAHMIGTPAYMSPEQAELSDLDVDTRTDIYSLGVLLYELLTGSTPFSEDERRKAGYLEMQRIICEKEPTRPSTKLSTLGEALTDVAKWHSSSPELMPRLVRGDLDWIVMKSLEKDRNRRYDTASALALDVQRHLNNEPVLARAPRAMYRLQKFLHRHLPQTIAAAAIAILIAGMIVIFSMWNQNRLQLAEAESLTHKSILSQARESFSKGDVAAALKSVESILNSKHVGSEAQLLYAGILVDGRHSDEAVVKLEDLLDERPEVAGAAHSLLARILWESESSESEKLSKVNEHRRKAEELLPETAEAYFLRAMTALTVKEKLELLDKALRLDPGHYESRRLRAFTYYASRKHESMKEDALVMVVLRPQDPLGYSLRAAALRELGNYEDAIADYDSAIELTSIEDPQHTELCAERCNIYLRMDQYDRVIADARECLEVAEDAVLLEFRIFCALTALGDYEEADSLFRRVAYSNSEVRDKFIYWSMKYVFDTLEADRSWYLPDRKPEGIAFVPMLEAERAYHHLSARARRLTTDGFAPRWSPDGTKLGFSMGFHGYSGVALYDMGTGQTELLIVPGKDPVWSPDGRYLAFVRDCSVLPVSELAGAERIMRLRPPEDEEVWFMNADGTEPRRLAAGGRPSWSSDSKHVYYQSPTESMLYLISIEDSDAEPKPILACSNRGLSVSPDDEYVAYVERKSLKIVDLASQLQVAEWSSPVYMWGCGGWSPTRDELFLAGDQLPEAGTGAWIYNLNRRQAAKVLDGKINSMSWTSDGTKLALNVGPPYFEIWVADLDPNVPTVEALGPGRTHQEHYQEMVNYYTHIIEADPENADGYLHRAQYYHYLHDEENVHADMDEYAAILNPQEETNAYSGWIEATGNQKAPTSFLLGTPTNLGPTVNSSACDWDPSISADGLELYFDSKRSGDWDIWVTKQATTEDDWGSPVNLGSPVNGPYKDQRPCISANGLMLFFGSLRSGGWDMWVTKRVSVDGPWGNPMNLGPIVNSSSLDFAPCISPNGLWLFFGSERPGGHGSADIWLTTRETVRDHWGTPMNLGPAVNSVVNEAVPSISVDGLSLFFSGAAYGPFRTNGYGNADLWVTTRTTADAPWNYPKNLGPDVNSSYYEMSPNISMDSSTLYFASNRDGGVGDFDLWQVPITYISQPSHSNSDADLAQKSVGSNGKEVVPLTEDR